MREVWWRRYDGLDVIMFMKDTKSIDERGRASAYNGSCKASLKDFADGWLQAHGTSRVGSLEAYADACHDGHNHVAHQCLET